MVFHTKNKKEKNKVKFKKKIQKDPPLPSWALPISSLLSRPSSRAGQGPPTPRAHCIPSPGATPPGPPGNPGPRPPPQRGEIIPNLPASFSFSPLIRSPPESPGRNKWRQIPRPGFPFPSPFRAYRWPAVFRPTAAAPELPRCVPLPPPLKPPPPGLPELRLLGFPLAPPACRDAPLIAFPKPPFFPSAPPPCPPAW